MNFTLAAFSFYATVMIDILLLLLDFSFEVNLMCTTKGALEKDPYDFGISCLRLGSSAACAFDAKAA